MNLDTINRYRVPKFIFYLVYRGASYRFAYNHILSQIVSPDKPRRSYKCSVVYRQFNKLRRIWVKRVKALVTNDLWTPGYREIEESIHSSVRRRLFCTPHCVELKNPHHRGRPCSEFNFCPFCYARRMSRLYRQIHSFIKAIPAAEREGYYVTCRVRQITVKASGFSPAKLWSPKKLQAAKKNLREALQREQRRYKESCRELRANTLGSAHTIIVNPTPTGWVIESRLFALSDKKPKNIFVRHKRARTLHYSVESLQAVKTMETGLAPFVAYPKGLLYGFEELAGVALQARYNLRLFKTTGCLRKKHAQKDDLTGSAGDQDAFSLSD